MLGPGSSMTINTRATHTPSAVVDIVDCLAIAVLCGKPIADSFLCPGRVKSGTFSLILRTRG